jgi:hypothetical protein
MWSVTPKENKNWVCFRKRYRRSFLKQICKDEETQGNDIRVGFRLCTLYYMHRCHGGVVGIMTTTKKLWFEIFGQRKRCFSSPNRPDLLGGPLSLAIGGKTELSSLPSSEQGVRLSAHLYLVPRLGMIGTRSPVPHTPSWRAQWRSNLYMYHHIVLTR